MIFQITIVLSIISFSVTFPQLRPSVVTRKFSVVPSSFFTEQESIEIDSGVTVDDSVSTDSFWNLFFSPPQPTAANKEIIPTSNLNFVPFNPAYGAIKELKDEGAPSFEKLSSQIKSIPTTSKVDFLPGIDAWRLCHASSEEDVAPPSLESYLSGQAKLPPVHDEQVKKLVDTVKNHAREVFSKYPSKAVDKISEAIRIAYIALWGKKNQHQFESSIAHACGTAQVLLEMDRSFCPLDVLLAGILHEVLAECSPGSRKLVRDSIASRFGLQTLQKLESYIQFPQFNALKANYTLIQSENMIQMLVATCEEYSSFFIRLAERLHTMRNLKNLPLNDIEKMHIAQEAINVYVPIAHRMMLSSIKNELEELALQIVNPAMYQKCEFPHMITQKFYDAHELIKGLVSTDPILKANQATAKVDYRLKSKYETYMKMLRKNSHTLSDIHDALGIRIIIDTKRFEGESDSELEQRENSLCYHVSRQLSLLLPTWKLRETKDYISERKETGYQSVHMIFNNKEFNFPMEIQIRSTAMHKNAEIGEAAHWYYKDLKYRQEIVNSKSYTKAWRSPAQIKADSPATIFRLSKEQLKDRVFIFLNDRATVLNLKKGSTCLDAAFNIHTELGLRTSFVKVNGRPVDPSHKLENGDVINVEQTLDGSITARPQHLEYVKTRAAVSTLRNYFKMNKHSIYAALGCVQFMKTISTNINAITSKYHAIPDARDLSNMVRRSTSFANINELMIELGTASKDEIATIMSDLLSIPKEQLTIVPPNAAIMWAKVQGKNGWVDRQTRALILLPLLRELLPSFGLKFIEQRWCDLVGTKSLTDEQSPYFPALVSHLAVPRQMNMKLVKNRSVLNPAISVTDSSTVDVERLHSLMKEVNMESESLTAMSNIDVSV